MLDQLSAVFEEGVSVGILGRNGAGKSTLLRILGGAEQPDSGRVIRKGRVSWPIGFSGGFNGSLTGEENARFVARIYDADIDRVIEFAKDFAEIGDYFQMPVRTYSSGMKARLAFGLSMAIDFDTYLVDEVTAVGDATFQERCREAFAEVVHLLGEATDGRLQVADGLRFHAAIVAVLVDPDLAGRA